MKLRPEVEAAVLDAKIAVTRLGASNCHERLLALVELGVRLGETEAIAIVANAQSLEDARRKLALLPLCDILQAQPGAEEV